MVLDGPSRSTVYRSTANTERSRYASVVSSGAATGGRGIALIYSARTDIMCRPCVGSGILYELLH